MSNRPRSPLPSEEAAALIVRFKAKFVGRLERSFHPLWDTFLLPMTRLEEDCLSKLSLPLTSELYLYWQFGKNDLRKVTLREAIKYFNEKDIWEDEDVFIFDDSFEWCIAFTHERDVQDENEPQFVFGVGSLSSIGLTEKHRE